jgi:hypothetical protein
MKKPESMYNKMADTRNKKRHNKANGWADCNERVRKFGCDSRILLPVEISLKILHGRVTSDLCWTTTVAVTYPILRRLDWTPFVRLRGLSV